jgi:hypothetical protein
MVFLSPSREMPGQYATLSQATTASFHIFPIYNSTAILSFEAMYY